MLFYPGAFGMGGGMVSRGDMGSEKLWIMQFKRLEVFLL
jgi:hypothetical protein